MANCVTKTRTNYFHVKSESDFREFIKNVHGLEGETVKILERKDKIGKTVFEFNIFDSICGFYPLTLEEDDEDIDYDKAWEDFIFGMQALIAENDAVIITTVGSEKMRYLVATSTIITAKNIQTIDLLDEVVKRTRAILNNQNWETQMDY